MASRNQTPFCSTNTEPAVLSILSVLKSIIGVVEIVEIKLLVRKCQINKLAHAARSSPYCASNR